MFHDIYTFLSRQIITPTLKHKCRIFPAKDLRQYSNLRSNEMSQMLGANWLYINKFSKKSFQLSPNLLLFLPILFLFILFIKMILILLI